MRLIQDVRGKNWMMVIYVAGCSEEARPVGALSSSWSRDLSALLGCSQTSITLARDR